VKPPRWQDLHRQLHEHHRQLHQHHHHHPHAVHWRRWRQEWRRYYGAHLHRRLFWWFGAAISVTGLLLFCLHTVLHVQLTGRPRVVLMFLVPMFAIWALSGKIARRLARPLYDVSQVAVEIGRGNLRARVQADHHGIDEIAFLGRSINDMAARIERQLAEQRELLAAVSHELRTPLARMRVLADIARQRGSHEPTVAEIEKEILEMDALVGELLASARLDFAALTPRPLDAVDAARRALERAGVPAGKLDARAPTAPLHADPTLLARALANLIENARKHGGGLERLGVLCAAAAAAASASADEADTDDDAGAGRREDLVIFEIDDRGPGFAPGEEQKVFEPFVRADASNGAGGDTGEAAPAAAEASPMGLGLGLALVARIARAHGGSVAAANRQGGGARLTLRLPVRPPAAGTSAQVAHRG
jgi:two-component system, OmpR family, sensor kinase